MTASGSLLSASLLVRIIIIFLIFIPVILSNFNDLESEPSSTLASQFSKLLPSSEDLLLLPTSDTRPMVISLTFSPVNASP